MGTTTVNWHARIFKYYIEVFGLFDKTEQAVQNTIHKMYLCIIQM